MKLNYFSQNKVTKSIQKCSRKWHRLMTQSQPTWPVAFLHGFWEVCDTTTAISDESLRKPFICVAYIRLKGWNMSKSPHKNRITRMHIQ